MPHASFFFHILKPCRRQHGFLRARGADDIEFDLSANKGEDARPAK